MWNQRPVLCLMILSVVFNTMVSLFRWCGSHHNLIQEMCCPYCYPLRRAGCQTISVLILMENDRSKIIKINSTVFPANKEMGLLNGLSAVEQWAALLLDINEILRDIPIVNVTKTRSWRKVSVRPLRRRGLKYRRSRNDFLIGL